MFGDFVVEAVDHMAQNGVTVHFVAKPRYNNCTGFFCFPNFHVAAQREYWQEIFVHEYCHFLQHLDEQAGKPVKYPLMKDQSYVDWWDWLDGKIDLDARKVRRIRRGIQQMERDCDRRAIELIKKRGLELDLDHYIRRANVYHLFYCVAEKHRKWYRIPPYDMQELMEMVPNKLLRSFDKVSPEFEAIVLSHCL